MEIPKKRLFKWIGGKNWLQKELATKADIILDNSAVDTYIEPFVGGLGSFLAIYPILKKNNIKKIILNDINPLIIETYKEVKNEPDKIFREIVRIEEEHYRLIPEEAYDLHATKDKIKLKEVLAETRLYFEKKRDEFNKIKFNDDIGYKEVALFLYIMQHCFNGVYRENSKGLFNVPFNWGNQRQNLEMKKRKIEEYSKFFNLINITFEKKDVFDLLDKYNNSNSFIYLDPPYINENITENKYSKEEFGFNEQIKLLNYMLKYDKALYSNHYIDFLINFFNEKNIKFDKIARKNIMSASNESRKEDIFEILAYKTS